MVSKIAMVRLGSENCGCVCEDIIKFLTGKKKREMHEILLNSSVESEIQEVFQNHDYVIVVITLHSFDKLSGPLMQDYSGDVAKAVILMDKKVPAKKNVADLRKKYTEPRMECHFDHFDGLKTVEANKIAEKLDAMIQVREKRGPSTTVQMTSD